MWCGIYQQSSSICRAECFSSLESSAFQLHEGGSFFGVPARVHCMPAVLHTLLVHSLAQAVSVEEPAARVPKPVGQAEQSGVGVVALPPKEKVLDGH